MSDIDSKFSRLYREASTEVPPAAVDAAILAAARRQAAQPRRPARSAWVRWMAPASALATLVVAVSLAFLVEREQPARTDDAVIHRTRPRPESVPAPAAEEPSKAARRALPGAAAKKDAQAPAPAAPAPVIVAPVQAPTPHPAEAAPFAAEAPFAERRAKAVAPRMVAPKPAAEVNAAGDAAAGGTGAAAPAALAGASKLAPLRQQTATRSPEAWLEEISRLKREGREQEAAEQLAEFRKAYPAYALPENILK